MRGQGSRGHTRRALLAAGGCALGLQQFFHITLPSLKPMIFLAVTLSVIGGLQLFEEPFILIDGIGPLIGMRSPEMYTLPLAMRSLQSPVNTEWGAQMAGSAIATVPLLVLFALSSRQIISGLTSGAVK